MNKTRTKAWFKAAGIRALRTVAQATIAVIGSGTMFSNIDWKLVVITSLLAGLLSILTSVAGLPETKESEV